MLVFKLKEIKTVEKFKGITLVNKFFVKIKDDYYTTLTEFMKKIYNKRNEDVEDWIDENYSKILRLLLEYHKLNLKNCIETVIEFQEDGMKCIDFYTLFLLGFTPEEIGSITKIHDYNHLVTIIKLQFMQIILNSFYNCYSGECLKVINSLKKDWKTMTIEEFLKLFNIIFDKKLRKKVLNIRISHGKISDMKLSLFRPLTVNLCFEGMNHTWLIMTWAGVFSVINIDDVEVLVMNDGEEKVVDYSAPVMVATETDSKEFLEHVPIIFDSGELAVRITLNSTIHNGKKSLTYVKVKAVNKNIKVVSTCRVFYFGNVLYALFKSGDRKKVIKFNVVDKGYSKYIELPGLGQVKIIFTEKLLIL